MDISCIIDNLFSETELRSLIYFDTLNSTNYFAKEHNLPDNVCVLASFQHNGKGRFERIWYSEPDKNLTFTLVKELNFKCRNQVNFYVSFIVLLTLREFTGIERSGRGTFTLKWPNDILLNGRKISGILTETDDSTENKIKFIIGVGVNINQSEFNFDQNYKATSLLKETGRDYSIVEFFNCLVVNFYTHLNLLTSGMIMSFWRVNTDIIGKKIEFRINETEEIMTGKVVSVEDDGAIIINCIGENSKNQSQKWYSGEISFIYS